MALGMLTHSTINPQVCVWRWQGLRPTAASMVSFKFHIKTPPQKASQAMIYIITLIIEYNYDFYRIYNNML